MKKVFIDCGGHEGESVIAALKRWGKFDEIHSFEANPDLWHFYKDLPTTLHQEAVWIYDGQTDFYIVDRLLSSGIHRDRVRKHKGSPINITKHLKVPCLDFSKWLLKNFTIDDYIILKMNVEGAEYEIYDKMFEDGSISLINELWGDLHRRQFPAMTKQDELAVLARFESIGLPFQTWSIQKSEK